MNFAHVPSPRYRNKGGIRHEWQQRLFYALKEARIIAESWRRHYNIVRPHGLQATSRRRPSSPSSPRGRHYNPGGVQLLHR
ncbi:MAG: transposase [Rhizobiaceae bacterium]|nr:transposase [Rhizobiaceae bacterium]